MDLATLVTERLTGQIDPEYQTTQRTKRCRVPGDLEDGATRGTERLRGQIDPEDRATQGTEQPR